MDFNYDLKIDRIIFLVRKMSHRINNNLNSLQVLQGLGRLGLGSWINESNFLLFTLKTETKK